VQICTGADTIDLGSDVTFLQQTTPNATGAPYALVLPPGNYIRQYKSIFVQSANQVNTAEFGVHGAFVGFNSLLFNNSGFSAVLTWDGSGWHMVGGNAQTSNVA
jgi:hypothetical protein